MIVEALACSSLYNYWTANAFMSSNHFFFGLLPYMDVALIEFTKEENYAIVHNKVDRTIFLLPKQLITEPQYLAENTRNQENPLC